MSFPDCQWVSYAIIILDSIKNGNGIGLYLIGATFLLTGSVLIVSAGSEPVRKLHKEMY